MPQDLSCAVRKLQSRLQSLQAMRFFICSAVALIALAHCARAQLLSPEPTDITFSYDPTAADGPSRWGTLPGSSICSSGNRQSPIDVPCRSRFLFNFLYFVNTPKITAATAIFNFVPTSIDLSLNCATAGTCGSTVFKGTTYNLINLHFHAESEHTVDGSRYPFEAHFVHEASDGTLLVIAILFSKEDSPDDCLTSGPNTGRPNSGFQRILDNVNSGFTTFIVNTGNFLESNLLKRIGRSITSYCTWAGSLTTPPCDETVTWVLARKRETISTAQVDAFQVITGTTVFGNSRPIQAFNDRQITCYYTLQKKRISYLWLGEEGRGWQTHVHFRTVKSKRELIFAKWSHE